MQLNYKLKTQEERLEEVRTQLKNLTPQEFTQDTLTYITDYLLFTKDKGQTKKEKSQTYPISTKNREVTINKRQMSLEQLILGLENGEDGLYALINNDKNQILDKKTKIKKQEYEENPILAQKQQQIKSLTAAFEKATGAARFNIKRQIIETWQEIYIIKAATTANPKKMPAQIQSLALYNYPEHFSIDENGNLVSDCKLSFLNPTHIAFLLAYYPQLKQDTHENLNSDMHWMLIDLEQLVERTLKTEPILYDLLVWKIDGLTNEEIIEKMIIEHDIYHNEQYYSTLWKKRIPHLLAKQFHKETLIWYYSNVEYGHWQKCSKCGQWLPIHPLFYTKNTTSSGYYSICKECRA